MDDPDSSPAEGGVNFSGIDDSELKVDNIISGVTAGRDIIGGDKHTIDTGGGSFVGRDQITYDISQQSSTLQPPASLFFGVPSLPDHLVGREEMLAGLVERLRGGEMAGLALSAEGLPGVGKTTLAVAVAHHPAIREHFSDGVLWAGLGPQPDVMSLLAGWGEALGVNVAERLDEASRSQAVKDAIGLRRLLLVIDDAWAIEPARRLRCGGPNCAHLLTSRNQGLARAFAGAGRVVRVPVLADDLAYALLEELAPEACAADPAAARTLVQAVGGLPLALELVGGYLAVPERHLFPDLSAAALAELAAPGTRLRLAQRRLGSPASAAQTLQEAIGLSLAGLPEAAVRAFYALGAFAPKPSSFERAAAEAVCEAEPATLALLAARNLLEVTGERLALHQTLADAARLQTPVEAVARQRAYYLGLAEADREDWRRIGAAYAQVKWAWANTPEEDKTRLEFIWALRTYQRRQGLWQDLLAWYKTGLSLSQNLGQRKDEGALLNNIGLVYDNLGQRPEALAYYERALPILEAVGDRYGESVTRYNLAMVYRAEGRLAEAAVELRRVVELDRLVQSPDLKADEAMLARVEGELGGEKGK
jgi:tetratricopeptide (TPR) repeat protein